MTPEERAKKAMSHWDFDTEPQPSAPPCQPHVIKDVADAIRDAVTADRALFMQLLQDTLTVGAEEDSPEKQAALDRMDLAWKRGELHPFMKQMAVIINQAEDQGAKEEREEIAKLVEEVRFRRKLPERATTICNEDIAEAIRKRGEVK